MTCHICRRDTPARMCDSCRTRLLGQLADMPALHALAGAVLEPSSGHHERVSGSTRAAPLPVRLDALSLRGPASPGAVHDPYGDQHGPPPILATLRVWEDDWRYWRALTDRDEHHHDPVAASAGFLRRHLSWAIEHHPAIGEFTDEINQLHRTASAVTGLTKLVHHLPAPCPDPDCNTLALIRRDGSSYVECRACGAVWSETQYHRLCLVLAGEAQQENP